MNKKLLVFLVILLGALSVMGIGIWGSLPDPSDSVMVESLEFSDSRIVWNEDNTEKIIYVGDIITDLEENYDMTIAFTYSPDNANIDYLVTYADDMSVGAVLQDHQVYVTFSAQKTVTITIKDKKTSETDTVILMFQAPDSVDVPDIFD